MIDLVIPTFYGINKPGWVWDQGLQCMVCQSGKVCENKLLSFKKSALYSWKKWCLWTHSSLVDPGKIVTIHLCFIWGTCGDLLIKLILTTLYSVGCSFPLLVQNKNTLLNIKNREMSRHPWKESVCLIK